MSYSFPVVESDSPAETRVRCVRANRETGSSASDKLRSHRKLCQAGDAPRCVLIRPENRVDKCKIFSYANALGRRVSFNCDDENFLILLLPETFLHFALLFRESRFGLSQAFSGFAGNFKLKFSCQNKFLSLLGGNRI
jgi:hypothetical protein